MEHLTDLSLHDSFRGLSGGTDEEEEEEEVVVSRWFSDGSGVKWCDG